MLFQSRRSVLVCRRLVLYKQSRHHLIGRWLPEHLMKMMKKIATFLPVSYVPGIVLTILIHLVS